MYDELVRAVTPRVLGSLVRRYGDFAGCEDALQEALLEASVQWPAGGVPDNPTGWLLTVASRRRIDQMRGETARRQREETVARQQELDPASDTSDQDDTLLLLFLCAHPSLSAASQLALTLRAVGGLTTAEIAGAFFVPEATMAQRISRAKRTISDSGSRFELPPDGEREPRLAVVRHVLYLIFNEGYTATSGPALQRADLTSEAIRLTRMLLESVPGDGEVAGLLALMLLTDARRDARVTANGELVPLAEQNRAMWRQPMIAEGVALVSHALRSTPLGPYQLQAAIAAIHDEAASVDDTDWVEIAALYELLENISPTPMVTLNRAVAVAMVDGPAAGLAILDALAATGELGTHHRLDAVRAHLLERGGDAEAARAAYFSAAERTASRPERDYLLRRAAALNN